jgi:predicted small lipoprotein YifL
VLVIRLSDRRLTRLAVVTVLIAALLPLAACGRKGGLDAPPSALPAAPQANAQPSLGEQAPAFGSNFGTPSLSSSLSPPPPSQQQAAQTPPPKKSFFLDWLIN